VLTSACPVASSTVGVAGDRLPYASRFSGNLAAEQTIPLGLQWSGTLRASANYGGDPMNAFAYSVVAPRLTLPSYVLSNLLAGVHYQSWPVNLYANKILDKRGILQTNLISPTEYSFNYPAADCKYLARENLLIDQRPGGPICH
jgi:hypothetical protein